MTPRQARAGEARASQAPAGGAQAGGQARGRRLPFAFTHLDAGVPRRLVYIDASDTAMSSAVLYGPPPDRAKAAVYLMHPRGDFSRHYAVPGLTARGFAVFCHNSRYLNNDTDMVHERLLFDVAAGVRFLRGEGYRRTVLLGNSGGGSLFSFYQAQAERAAAERIAKTPAGEPVPLAAEEMPPADLYVAVAAHPGEGRFLLGAIDPAVTDEADPAQTDAAWDMYEPANGYRPFPQPSAYDPAWLAGYRERQRQRVARLDATARGYIAEQREHLARLRDPSSTSLPDEARAETARRAWLWRYMLIYRTLANPACLDPTIDPNRRPLGSIFSPGDPIIGNYGPLGLARTMTPRAWLSTWSGLSSQAEMPDTIGGVSVPTLIVYPDADSDIYPSEQHEIFENAGAKDKTYVTLEWAGHYLNPVGEQGAKLPDPRDRLIDIIVPWMEQRL